MVSGLFAVKNRVFGKIIQKQVDVVEELEYHLREHVQLELCRIIQESYSMSS
jgi:hypothetical protein